jgi:mono/diheme cytochrome c family protein
MSSRPTLLLSALAAVFALGCQETIKKESPIHPNWNMDQTVRIDAQEPAPKDIFADGRGMRTPVAGTIAVGRLRADDHFWRGQVNGDYAETLPSSLTLDADFVARGRDRFEIYCTPCHDKAGTGNGTVASRGITQPPTFHSAYLKGFPVGRFFDVMTNGVRTMPSYAAQIPAEDRWAIATYVRALQVAGVDSSE